MAESLTKTLKRKQLKSVRINGSVLRCIIQARRVSRQQVADAVGVSHQRIWNWMWDEVNPREEHFIKLCEALDIPQRILSISSIELLERSRTNRVVRWSVNEMLGLNEEPEYVEIAAIIEDINAESDRVADEDEVRKEETGLPSEIISHSDSKPNTDSGDEVS